MTESKNMEIEEDEICEFCTKPRADHNSEEKQNCSRNLIEMGILRYCGLCGVSKPAKGSHDRCGKCGEKYSFINH